MICLPELVWNFHLHANVCRTTYALHCKALLILEIPVLGFLSVFIPFCIHQGANFSIYLRFDSFDFQHSAWPCPTKSTTHLPHHQSGPTHQRPERTSKATTHFFYGNIPRLFSSYNNYSVFFFTYQGATLQGKLRTPLI